MGNRPHKKLKCWEEGIALVKSIYLTSQSFPLEEKFGITSQIRKAAVSVPLNIAEGAARKSAKEFSQFLYIAEGSLSEIDTILIICIELNYISQKDYLVINEKLELVSALTKGLIKKLNTQHLLPNHTVT